jgi:uncharacterized protein YpuA (DUF1002 family)
MKKSYVLLFVFLLAVISPRIVFADATVGDSIITLGEDLSEQEREGILKELGAPENAQIITVSNEEEHKYLGKYIPKAQIGNRALSSSKITIMEKGAGLSVQTTNINWVTEEMFTNALITAGVKDADIQITAPFEVSGTAALTGLIKAYEISTDSVIPEAQKEVANEEMVKSAKLADSIGVEKATALINRIKEEIAKNKPENAEEMRALIDQIAKELGIQLTQEEMDGLVSLFERMKNLNIDWNQVGDQLQAAKERLETFISSEEGKSLIAKAKDFFTAIFDAILSLFK